MKYSILAAVSLAALVQTGCKKEAPPAADEVSAAPSDMAMATASPANAGQNFADAAAASDIFEIETSKLAATKAQSARVKRFAEQMIKAHTESTAKLKTAASAASITPRGQMTPLQQRTLADLAPRSGADFDSAYAKAQADVHQMTLDALKAYSASGDVPSLKAFATETVPIVTAHLNMSKGL